MNGIKKEEFKAALICYLLSVAIFYIGLSFPLIWIALPFVTAYSVARGGYIIGGGAAVLSLITGYFFSIGAFYILTAAFLPVAFAAGYAIRSKRRLLHSVFITGAGALAGAALTIFVISYLSGLSFIGFVVNYFTDSLKAQDPQTVFYFYQLFKNPDLMMGTVSQGAVSAVSVQDAISFLQGTLKDMLNGSLVSMIGIYSLTGGFLYYVIPRAIAKSNKLDVVRIPVFSDYQLPKRFWLAFALTYLAAIIGESIGLKSFDIVESTVFDVYAFIFMGQALCFLDFFYKKRGMGTGLRVLLHVLATLIFGVFLAFLGLLENIINIRKRMSERQV